MREVLVKRPFSIYVEDEVIRALDARAHEEQRSRSYLVNELLHKEFTPGRSDDPMVEVKKALHPAQLATEAAERQGFLIQPASALAVEESGPPPTRMSRQEQELVNYRTMLQNTKAICQHPSQFHEMKGQIRMCLVCGEEVE